MVQQGAKKIQSGHYPLPLLTGNAHMFISTILRTNLLPSLNYSVCEVIPWRS